MRLQKLIKDIESLGSYSTEFGTSNKERPNQQLIVYKEGKTRPVAKVSLMLANRVNTIQNGVGRDEKELLELLVNFSKQI